EREEADRVQPVDRERLALQAELPEHRADPPRPLPGLGGRFRPAELPRERRSHVPDQLLRDVQRALVLEQDRRALGGDDAVARERPGGPDAHHVDPGRVADVGRPVEQTDRQPVALHHRLQPGQPAAAELGEVDLAEIRDAERADATPAGENAVLGSAHGAVLLSGMAARQPGGRPREAGPGSIREPGARDQGPPHGGRDAAARRRSDRWPSAPAGHGGDGRREGADGGVAASRAPALQCGDRRTPDRPDMARFCLRHLLALVITLGVVSFLVFAVNEFSPGDVARKILGAYATDEQVTLLTRQMGLDRPLLVRYVEYLRKLAAGDLGFSTRFKVPVGQIIWARLENTLILAALAFALIVPVSMLLGILAGMREGSWLDRAILVFSTVVASVPEFAMGVFLSSIFVVWLGWLPGTATLAGGGGWSTAAQFVLPVAVVVLYVAGYVVSMIRASMVEVMQRPYIRTAVLKGMGFRRVVLAHALRNA